MAKRQSQGKSRAQQVRERRRSRRKKAQTANFGNSAARKKTNRRPPVTQRVSHKRPVVNQHRHKVSMPLKSAPGAEVQIPALPKLRMGWRLISGMVFIVSLVVVFGFFNLEFLQVDSLKLKGANRLDQETLLAELSISGKSIVEIIPAEIKQEIEMRFPELSDVRVSIGFPAVVTINVVERQPLITWRLGEQETWIDSTGVMFPPRGDVEAPLMVIATSPPPSTAPLVTDQESPDETISDEQEPPNPVVTEVSQMRTSQTFVDGIIALSGYLPEGSTLEYNSEFGLGWRDPQGWMVYFGKSADEIQLKLVEYQTIIEALDSRQLLDQLAFISLEFLDAPFFQVEQ